MPPNYTFQIHFSGSSVKGTSINAADLATYIQNFISYINHLVKFRHLISDQYPAEAFTLYFSDLLQGSVIGVTKFATPIIRTLVKDPIEMAERYIIEDFEHLQSDQGLSYFKEEYRNPNERILILKDLKKFSDTKPGNNVSLDITPKNNPKKIIHSFPLNSQVNTRCINWLNAEKGPSPKTVGEYAGFQVKKDSKISLSAFLLNGEFVKCDLEEKTFGKIIDRLNRHDMIRIHGDYTKEPGLKTQAKISNVERITKIKDEMDVTFEQYRDSFKNTSVAKSPHFQEFVTRGFRIFKENYAVLKILGEDS